jgi:hypothetical protein
MNIFLGGASVPQDGSIFQFMRILCISLSVYHAYNVPNQVTN